MARVTVEDCTIKIPNRFELVILSAERAKNIASGAPLATDSTDRKNEKDPVIALREIAAGNIDPDALRASLVSNLQKNNNIDEVPEENLHAETQDKINEDINHTSSAEDDIFSHDESTDLEVNQDFADNITEEDLKF